MVQKTRPVLPKTVLRAITIGSTISSHAARREADRADYDAGWAYLDDRLARCEELRRRARELRRLADEADNQATATS